jgi:hypothetical protein
MIVAGVLIAVVVIVVVVSRLGGSSTSGTATTPVVSAGGEHVAKKTSKTHTASEASEPALSPSETSVTVLNGTETPDLAHRLAEGLQQSGYTRAVALGGTPTGSHPVTVAEYASGHRAEAEGVAKAAGVSDVKPMASSVATLSNGANVVLIIGADRASTATSTPTGESSAGSPEAG